MNLLETYIFGRTFRMFVASLVPVLAIIWITQVLGRINLVTDSGQSIGSFAALATYMLPTLIPIVMPFAVTIAVTQTLQTMNTDSELAVVDAAGARRSVLYKPALVLAAILCVVSFSVDNFLEPVSRLGMRKTIAATYADLLSSVIEEKAFRKIDDGLYVQISERVQGRVLRGLFVADSRNPQFDMIYYAREGAVDENGGTLIMKDGEIHRKIRGGEVSVIHFDSYSFDLSELSASRGQATLRAVDRDIFFLLNPAPDDAWFKEKPNDFRAELHRRLTDWFFPVTFALISLMMAGAAHSHRERRLNPLISSLFIAFAYRWITFYLANRIENGVSGPGPLYAFLIVTNVLMILAIWRNSNRLGRSALFPRLADGCIFLYGRLAALRGTKEGCALMPGTLFRYFLKRHLTIVFWFLIGVTGLVYLVDFIEIASRRGDIPGFRLVDALLLTLIRVPSILQQTLPFVMLFSGVTALVTLNRRQEMVVTRAAGISVWQFMAPFVTGAIIVGLVGLFVLNPLAAAGMRMASDIENSLKASKSLGRKDETIPWLRQISASDDVIVGGARVSTDGTTLEDAVFIHFGPEGRIILRQDAAEAKLKDGYWELNRVTETAPGQIPRVVATVQVRTNLKREFVQERLARPETIAFLDIPAKIAAAKSFGVSTSALESQYHSLMSMPFLLVAMTLISATVSLKFSRFNQSQSMIFGGVVSGFVLYVITVLVRAFGSSGVVPPFVAAWIPVVVAMFLGSTILLHQEDG